MMETQEAFVNKNYWRMDKDAELINCVVQYTKICHKILEGHPQEIGKNSITSNIFEITNGANAVNFMEAVLLKSKS